jgi:hypothetical protein
LPVKIFFKGVTYFAKIPLLIMGYERESKTNLNRVMNGTGMNTHQMQKISTLKL